MAIISLLLKPHQPCGVSAFLSANKLLHWNVEVKRVLSIFLKLRRFVEREHDDSLSGFGADVRVQADYFRVKNAGDRGFQKRTTVFEQFMPHLFDSARRDADSSPASFNSAGVRTFRRRTRTMSSIKNVRVSNGPRPM